MKYTTCYLMALTLVVAIMCTVGRYLGPEGALGVALIAGFFLAPSVLAFLLIPFRSIPVVVRQRVTLGFLTLLGLPAAIAAAVIVDPTVGFFLVVFAFSFWAPQVALLKDLHS